MDSKYYKTIIEKISTFDKEKLKELDEYLNGYELTDNGKVISVESISAINKDSGKLAELLIKYGGDWIMIAENKEIILRSKRSCQKQLSVTEFNILKDLLCKNGYIWKVKVLDGANFSYYDKKFYVNATICYDDKINCIFLK